MTPVQLQIIPCNKRDEFAVLISKGMRPSKAAGKLGVILTQHESQILCANPHAYSLAASMKDIETVYSSSQYGESCMSGCPEAPAYMYATIGAHVAYNNGARVVVNPKTKLFGRIYGNRSSEIYYSLLADGWRESPAPLVGLSGNLAYKTETELVEFWSFPQSYYNWNHYKDMVFFEFDKGMSHGSIIKCDGVRYIVTSRSPQKCNDNWIVGAVKAELYTGKTMKTLYKMPAKFYLDGEHSCEMDGNKLIITKGSGGHFVRIRENVRRVRRELTVVRKIERKTVADIGAEIEARFNGWRGGA